MKHFKLNENGHFLENFLILTCQYTPGTVGGPSGRDRTLAVKRRKTPENHMHISSSYAKILGDTNFYTREIPQSGSKAEDREKRKEK